MMGSDRGDKSQERSPFIVRPPGGEDGGFGRMMGSDKGDKSQERSSFLVVVGMGCLALVAFLFLARGVFVASEKLVEAEKAQYKEEEPPTPPSSLLSVATWNVAAVNNNPFEYWITHHDAAYNTLMADVQKFVDAPGDRDVAVREVFTEARE